MSSTFGHTATAYDESFTHTISGKYQREEVYRYLSPFLKGHEPLKILELNCGTGEDALYLSALGHHITVTDISEEMVEVARQKLQERESVQFQVLDISALDDLQDKGPYDLIFSNFGGLNCVSPEDLNAQETALSKLLKSTGVFIGIIMGRKCLWERFYFGLKGDKKAAKRRRSLVPILANVDGTDVPTWYYSPEEFGALWLSFTTLKTRPIGLFIPPSYLDAFFKNKRWFLRLMSLKSRFFHPSWASDYADHYFIALSR
jgi:SAM-dependent methyltransferase